MNMSSFLENVSKQRGWADFWNLAELCLVEIQNLAYPTNYVSMNYWKANPCDELYATQKEAQDFLKFKGLTFERFVKELEINTVKLESGFSIIKYMYIENRLRQRMGDDYLECAMTAYLTKIGWLKSI